MTQQVQGQRLIQLGMVLFLLGLLSGFSGSFFAIPRLALSAHLEGVLNGIFFAVLGLFWGRLVLSAFWRAATFWLTVYAGLANWLAVVLAGVWGAGGGLMPIATGGTTGTPTEEAVVTFLLLSLSAAIISALLIIIAGLRKVPGAASA